MTTVKELVEQHVLFADKLAAQKKKMLPKFIDIEEIKSAAYMGLVEAANRYNPNIGVKFTTFSYPRIFGAIHDYLREQKWVKSNDCKKMYSLDFSYEYENLHQSISSDPSNKIDELFEEITFNLNDQSKQIMKSYFICDNSMKEVGEQFGISESRVSQIIKKCKDSIKESFSSELAA